MGLGISVLDAVNRALRDEAPPGRRAIQLYYILRLLAASTEARAHSLEDALWDLAAEFYSSQLAGEPSKELLREMESLVAQHRAYLKVSLASEWAALLLESSPEEVGRGYRVPFSVLADMLSRLLEEIPGEAVSLRLEVKSVLRLVSELEPGWVGGSGGSGLRVFSEVLEKAERLARRRAPPVVVLGQKPGSTHPGGGRRF